MWPHRLHRRKDGGRGLVTPTHVSWVKTQSWPHLTVGQVGIMALSCDHGVEHLDAGDQQEYLPQLSFVIFLLHRYDTFHCSKLQTLLEMLKIDSACTALSFSICKTEWQNPLALWTSGLAADLYTPPRQASTGAESYIQGPDCLSLNLASPIFCVVLDRLLKSSVIHLLNRR